MGILCKGIIYRISTGESLSASVRVNSFALAAKVKPVPPAHTSVSENLRVGNEVEKVHSKLINIIRVEWIFNRLFTGFMTVRCVPTLCDTLVRHTPF